MSRPPGDNSPGIPSSGLNCFREGAAWNDRDESATGRHNRLDLGIRNLDRNMVVV